MDISEHKNWFAEYAKKKIDLATDPFPLETKLEHTMRVFDNAEFIMSQENFSSELTRAGLLAALYHDLGRFDQYLTYGTFKDSLSINHGALSLKILKKSRVLSGERYKSAILAAVGLHNRRELPITAKGDILALSRVVRDADKIDIIKVIASHLRDSKPYNPTVILSLPDNDDFSEIVAEKILSGRVPSYDDLRSVNDFRLMLGAWFLDMNFKGSRELFLKSGFGRELALDVPDREPYRETRRFILDILK